MDNKHKTTETEVKSIQQQIKQPDERSGIKVEGFIKIFDPVTEEVIVKGRA